MIAPTPSHKSASLTVGQLREVIHLVDEADDTRHRLAALQLSCAPSRTNLSLLNHALLLETEGKNRPYRIAHLSNAITNLEAKLTA